MTRDADCRVGLRPYQQADRASIAAWPAYTGEFSELDYALRQGGWIDEFQARPNTWIYSAHRGEDIVGFAIVSMTGPDEAEFRIALRSDVTGRGYGRRVAEATLRKAFDEIGLERIHLIVRRNNHRAIALYRGLNFSSCGGRTLTINHKPVEFILMERLSV